MMHIKPISGKLRASFFQPGNLFQPRAISSLFFTLMSLNIQELTL